MSATMPAVTGVDIEVPLHRSKDPVPSQPPKAAQAELRGRPPKPNAPAAKTSGSGVHMRAGPLLEKTARTPYGPTPNGPCQRSGQSHHPLPPSLTTNHRTF